MRKKLFALLLAALLCVPLVAAPASAVESRGAVGDVIGNIFETYIRTGSPLYNILSALLAPDKDPATATNDDWQNAYNVYVQNVQNNYGGTQFSSANYFTWTYSPRAYLDGSVTDVSKFHSSVVSSSSVLQYKFQNIQPNRLNPQYFVVADSSEWICPASGTYMFYLPSLEFSSGVSTGTFVKSFFLRLKCNGDRSSNSELWQNSTISLESFALRFNRSYPVTCVAGETYSFFVQYMVDVSSPSLTGLETSVPFMVLPSSVDPTLISNDTRVGTFSGNFNFQNTNGDIVMAENVQIVNETNNTFYNPVTGDTYNVTNWTYDYSDRSYQLTLESGVVLSVTFGVDGVLIVEGDKTYNLQYNSGGGGVEPSPSPSPSPSPTPTPGPTPTPPVDPDEPGGSGGIIDAILNLGKTILDGILGVLKAFFIPSEKAMTDFSDNVNLKLPLIADLQDLGDELVSTLENPAQSVADLRMSTTVDLGKKADGIYGGAQVDILDMSWYMEYKPMVDDIVVGMFWLVFLWNLYGQLPAIIHGGASGLHLTAQINDTLEDRENSIASGKKPSRRWRKW